ncbi:hypothetical protein [Paraburkholderia caballeronis]|uniref:Uncharacterized protein n=1 Tax=Paraburkholderia caballeronis TaxID=416943 RepID=A0A1H7L1X8_9BURK|nr:hypothetical protein [Paraburkholderia caballeronis]PXW28260.1 hypothetical protein C7403_102152 [Paraburkholderia caballeronis]PXX03626.1 hypothetical protein C7407_102152 [Paraburkholderia caballeronis]RAK04370.1 hypothetical protein C7409_102152 [Paraburkholderia caballeronis]SED82936.1 hypothetical protein SAMN05445871_4027 [Paraburkholderia caballeronis]SEK93002.1 hypothetical protein SAMN05192542_104152 [Paraburkholderia caballeronis]
MYPSSLFGFGAMQPDQQASYNPNFTMPGVSPDASALAGGTSQFSMPDSNSGGVPWAALAQQGIGALQQMMQRPQIQSQPAQSAYANPVAMLSPAQGAPTINPQLLGAMLARGGA